jgi:hypothetical protein
MNKEETSIKRHPTLTIPLDAIRRGSNEEFKEAIEKGLGCINENHTNHDDDPHMRECVIHHGLINKLMKIGNLELLLYLARKENLYYSQYIVSENKLALNGTCRGSEWHTAFGALLNENGESDTRTMMCAARDGHLKLIQELHAVGCPWDAWTCAYAAQSGHIEVVQWARENGCPWDKWTCRYARERGHTELLQWALENGCPDS